MGVIVWVTQRRGPTTQILQCMRQISHTAPLCNRNVHRSTNFCYRMIHYLIDGKGTGALWLAILFVPCYQCPVVKIYVSTDKNIIQITYMWPITSLLITWQCQNPGINRRGINQVLTRVSGVHYSPSLHGALLYPRTQGYLLYVPLSLFMLWTIKL